MMTTAYQVPMDHSRNKQFWFVIRAVAEMATALMAW
jgi:hypothetical protein